MPRDDKYPLALPQGTILSGQYIIDAVLGQGGFGITYRALDHKNNNRPIALKEYFPDSLVYREMNTVISYPGERRENFEYGKKCFVEEAETLAKFIGNSNIVRVYSYFEENGTAYFAMEYIDGIPFDKYLRQKGGRITIDEAKAILIPVMDALGAVHSQGIIHRDVTPDNIYLTKDNRIMLLDFGAARYSLGDKSKSLDVVLKHGFAPKEQYSRKGKQGPFTDVYSLGATFYFALTGRRPPDAIERIESDALVPPTQLGVALTPYQEKAILTAMAILPNERFQSMAEFKNVLLSDRSMMNPVQFTGTARPIAPPVVAPPVPPASASYGRPMPMMNNRLPAPPYYGPSGMIPNSQQIGSSQNMLAVPRRYGPSGNPMMPNYASLNKIPNSQNPAAMNRISPAQRPMTGNQAVLGQVPGMSPRLHTNQGGNAGYSVTNLSAPVANGQQQSAEEIQRRIDKLKQRQLELEQEMISKQGAIPIQPQQPVNNAALQQRASNFQHQQSVIGQQPMSNNAALQQRVSNLQRQQSVIGQQPMPNNAALQQRASNLQRQQSVIGQQPMPNNAALQQRASNFQRQQSVINQPMSPQMKVEPVSVNSVPVNRVGTSQNISSGNNISQIPRSGPMPSAPPVGNSQAFYPTSQNSNNKNFIVGIVAVCVVIFLTILALVIFSGGKSKVPDASVTEELCSAFSGESFSDDISITFSGGMQP